MKAERLIVGISGASGVIYGIRLLELLQPLPEVETHLVCTRAAQLTIALETEYSMRQVRELADYSYAPDNLAASLSSGSFPVLGMLVAPCSINTLSCIANSVTKDLLTRAADVTLKERRPLVLLVRESPLHLGHLRRLVELAELGAVIAPPMPAFYHHPTGIEDLIDHSLGRALDQIGVAAPWLKRWRTPDSDPSEV